MVCLKVGGSLGEGVCDTVDSGDWGAVDTILASTELVSVSVRESSLTSKS